MPYPVYKRKRYTTRRYYPKPAPSRWSIYGGAGKQLVKDVMYLKTLINSEPHHYTVQDANNVNYNGQCGSLSNVPVGDGAEERTGTRILPRYLNMNWQIGQTDTATYTIRLLIFRWWGEATDAAPPTCTPGEVLYTVGTQFAPLTHLQPEVTGPKGDRNRRVEVLRNEIFTLDGTQAKSTTRQYDIEVNGMNAPRKEHIEYGASAQPVSGGFFFIIITDNVASNVYYKVESKMVFYDN